ncbi:hypothetical protein JHC09_06835 [Devosia sp. MC532]|uniref:hypothetical protein n=1 Tax=Devosia sp. MC532 TaxID=2799788 RepID=UPI0018F31993|nr:hypothetical protein [Devosia sp. MC532]MBJ7577599.1 hypothetical protein [Devosia sp. MC532]
MALRIFLHAIRMLLAHFRVALQISAALYIGSLIIYGIGAYVALQMIASGGRGAASWLAIITVVLPSLIYVWIAVAWHRFVLTDEVPHSAVPTPPRDRLLAYAGRGLLLLLLLGIFSVGIALATMLVSTATNPSQWALVPLIVVAVVLIALITSRLSPVFPATAIGQPISFGQVWEATSGATGTLLLVTLITAIAAFIIDLPSALLVHLPGGAFLNLVWGAIASWIKMMVGISILTTVYGVYIEKRTID